MSVQWPKSPFTLIGVDSSGAEGSVPGVSISPADNSISAGAFSFSNSISTDGKVLATDGLGVGNSIAATTPGAVVKKIEVYDEDGVSIGFIAVYGAIT